MNTQSSSPLGPPTVSPEWSYEDFTFMSEIRTPDLDVKVFKS